MSDLDTTRRNFGEFLDQGIDRAQASPNSKGTNRSLFDEGRIDDIGGVVLECIQVGYNRLVSAGAGIDLGHDIWKPSEVQPPRGMLHRFSSKRRSEPVGGLIVMDWWELANFEVNGVFEEPKRAKIDSRDENFGTRPSADLPRGRTVLLSKGGEVYTFDTILTERPINKYGDLVKEKVESEPEILTKPGLLIPPSFYMPVNKIPYLNHEPITDAGYARIQELALNMYGKKFIQTLVEDCK